MFIRQLSVKNYRSLRDVAIGNLSSLVTLYGENNSGKSNVLSFLEQVFKTKQVDQTVELSKTDNLSELESPLPKGLGDFWQGEINNFSDNFYNNVNDPITFNVLIRFTKNEIVSLGSFPNEFLDKLPSTNVNININIEGTIEKISEQRARMKLVKVTLNNQSFYDIKKNKPVYLSDFNITDSARALDTFQIIMGSLNNAFLRISPDRYVSKEKEVVRNEKVELSHGTFKNWLLQTNLDRDQEKIFRGIINSFDSAPFNHGRISLARIDDETIEVFVEDENSLKLPLGRKGSGIQQILMILSFVAITKSKFIGIEEPEINLSPRSQASIFNNLLQLVRPSGNIVNQVFITTHSPLLAKRDEAARRGVWMDNGETKIKKPTEAEVENFFSLVDLIYD